MKEAEEYKTWCSEKGYKVCDTKALHEYYEDKRTQRIRLFRSKMSLHGDTLDSLASHLGIVRQTLSRKINGEADFTQSEMFMIKSKYELEDEEFTQMFAKENYVDEHSRSSQEVK